MTTKKKFGIGAIFTTVLLVTILVSVVSAQENTTKELTFGPETLDKLKSDPYFIAAYGSIPAFTTSEERYQWIDTLNNIMDEVDADFRQDQEASKYFDPIGPVKTHSVTFDGIVEVSINNSTTVDKPFMDEFYQIIDSEASNMGIKEVPVVFVHENNLTLADFESSELSSKTSQEVIEKTANLSALEELNNSSNNDSEPFNENSSNLNNSSKGKSSVISSTPCFGLLESLTCLYVGLRLRKK
jgi:hypothetical protein